MASKIPLQAQAKKRGRPVEILSHLQVSTICRHLYEGHGRVIACGLAGVTYGKFLKRLRKDAAFAVEVRRIETSRVEACERALYKLATEGADGGLALRAAVAYLGRREKVELAREAKRQKARARRAEEARSRADLVPAPVPVAGALFLKK